MRRIAVRRSLQWLEKSWFRQEEQPLSMPDNETITPEAYSKLGTEDILQLVTGMPPGYRAVFNLYVVENYSHQEIADILGITEATSRSQLARARYFLQQKLHQLNNSDHYEMATVRK